MSRHAISVVLAVASLALALPGDAKDPKPKKKAAPAPAAAQRAVIDPKTGELTDGPVPAEARRSAPASAPSEFFPEEPVPGGGTKVNLDGRFMVATVARIDAQGNLTLDCVRTDEKGLKGKEIVKKTEKSHAHPH